MKKKLGALVLTLALVLSLAAPASAAFGTTEVTWRFDAGTGTLTFSGTGEMQDYNVPCGNVLPWASHSAAVRSVVIEDGITSVGACSFYHFPNLSSVSIPSSVERICWSAFEHCTSLRSVVIPEGVISVGNWSFQGCSGLTDVSIPSTLSDANYTSFADTPWMDSLGDFPTANGILLEYQGSSRDIVIPDGVTTITCLHSNHATHVTIPASVTEIINFAFEGCPNLTEFTVAPENPVYASRDGVLFSRDQTTLISYPAGKTGAYTIPAGVTEIAESAFSSCAGLTGVTIPSGVKTIGKFAFYGTSLRTLTVPGTVTSIGENAFSDCEYLTAAVLEPGVTHTGRYGFDGCTSLTSVTLPDTLTSIDYCAFWDCTALKRIDIPGSVTSIGQYAFNIALETPIPGLVLHGAAGSAAERYANQTGMSFVADYSPPPAPPVTPPAPAAPAGTAYASTQTVLVNGAPVTFEAYALKDASGNDTNYVKLRDVAFVLNDTSARFQVGWDGAASVISITSGTAYTSNGTEMSTPYTGNRPYTPAASTVTLDGTPVALDAILLQDNAGNGYTYFKLRDLGENLGFLVDWSPEKGIYLETE